MGKIIYKALLLILLLVTSSAQASNHKVLIRAYESDNYLIVNLVNTGLQRVYVNPTLTLDILGTLKFVFQNSNSTAVLGPNIRVTNYDDEYKLLKSGEVIGQAFDKNILKALYNLKSGCYSLEITYKDNNAGNEKSGLNLTKGWLLKDELKTQLPCVKFE